MLTLNALSCERDGQALFLPLDLEVESGDFIELRGANGAGSRLAENLRPSFPALGLISSGSLSVSRSPTGTRLLSLLENLAWFGAGG